MDAIHTLHQLEIENRNATEQEQDILSKYVGWVAWQMRLMRKGMHGQTSITS